MSISSVYSGEYPKHRVEEKEFVEGKNEIFSRFFNKDMSKRIADFAKEALDNLALTGSSGGSHGMGWGGGVVGTTNNGEGRD